MSLRRVKILAAKELARLVRNRGAITMAVLLCAAALLVALLGRGSVAAPGVRAVRIHSIDYWEDGPWIEHLRRNVAPELVGTIRFRSNREIPTNRSGILQYEADECAIQVRVDGGQAKVWSWHPGDDPEVLVPFEDWFWRETGRHFHQQAIATAPPERRAEIEKLVPPVLAGDSARMRQQLQQDYRDRVRAIAPDAAKMPEFAVERSSLRAIDLRQAIAIALIYFSTFFVCVCLAPSMTCEERERGALAAQLLTPATPLDLYLGKAIAFVPVGFALAWIVGGLTQPAVLIDPFFAAVTLVGAISALGVGMVIAAIAPTQRAASMAAMAYALLVALVVFSGQRLGKLALGWPFLESHLPPLVRAALDGSANGAHWIAISVAASIALGWALAAAFLVRATEWKA